MSDSTPLPPPYQRKIYATAKNTDSVRKGFEMGGYVKTPDIYTAAQVIAIRDAAVADAVQRERQEAYLDVIRLLNSNPYNLTKAECIDQVEFLRRAAPPAAAIRATPAPTPNTERTAP